MTQIEIFSAIEKAGLVPVPVVADEGDLRETIHYFDGPLDAYLATIKALEARAVFVLDTPLREEDFCYWPDEAEEDAGAIEIDLAAASKSLAKFKKQIGETYAHNLIAKGGIADLRLHLEQDWVGNFEDEWTRAQAKAVLDPSKAGNN